MNMKQFSSFIFFIVLLLATVFAQQVNVGVIITQRITKDNGRTEQRCAKVSHDVYDNGKLFIAAGTPVILDIQVEKHKGLGQPGTIIVRPVCTTDIYGQIVALSGAAKSDVGTDRRNAAVACGTVFGIITFPVGLFWLCLKGGKGVIPAGSQMVATTTLQNTQTPQQDNAPNPPQTAELPRKTEKIDSVQTERLSPETPAVSVEEQHPVQEDTVFSAKKEIKPYNQSFGIVAGCLNGLSYKILLTDHFAVSLELGVKVTSASGKQQYEDYVWNNSYNYYRYWNSTGFFSTPYTLEFNVNFLYEDHFAAGLYGLIGGGPSLGWHFRNNIPYYYQDYYGGRVYSSGNGKAGVNMLFGLEYVFNVPISLQLDFRPGYGLIFNSGYTAHYFDWGLNLGVRYTFK